MKPDNRKCKYDTMAPPINKDAQTKCVTCNENDADNPEAYEACLKYPVESVNPTTICESTAGCALVETEIEERKWENGIEDFVKSTNAVQRVCKDDLLDLDMNRIKIREDVSQCRGDLCNKRKFEVDPVCLPSITTGSPTTDATTTDQQTSTSLTTPSSAVTTPTVIQTTTTTTAPKTTTKTTTTLLTTSSNTTTILKSTTKSEQATGSLTSSQTPSTTTTDPKTSTADSSLKTTVASLTTQAFLTSGATTLSLLPDQDQEQTTVSLAIIGTIIGLFVTIFIIMIAIRRR